MGTAAVALADWDRFLGQTTGRILRDLRAAGLRELSEAAEPFRRVPRILRPRRRFAPLGGDLIWRLAGIVATALLTCLLDSTIVRALAQAAVVGALTVVLSRPPGQRTPAAPPPDLATTADAGPACATSTTPSADRTVVVFRVVPATTSVLVAVTVIRPDPAPEQG